LPFDPDASFQSVVGWLRSDRNGEDEHTINMTSTCRDSWGVHHTYCREAAVLTDNQVKGEHGKAEKWEY